MQQLWGTAPGVGTVEDGGDPVFFTCVVLSMGIFLEFVPIPMFNLQFASK
ncbi:hypothetical protein QOZ95_004270 [Paenibacillus brasilensis]|uniref:Uncharacterized protein n=1 Tax=Paenibacillus brasilensis TaxID=128574 RepID=A0ABU0L475_9BACL|nr:hypothetical protein [Paenibacillus brasilensis]